MSSFPYTALNRFGTFRIGFGNIILLTHQCVTFHSIVVPVAVVVVIVNVAVVGGAIHILHDGRHAGAPSLAERLQQRRQG